LTIFVSQHLFVALNRQICFAVTLCVTLGIYNFCCIPNKKTDEISENWINEMLRMETVRLTNPNKMEICVFILKSLMIHLIPKNVIPLNRFNFQTGLSEPVNWNRFSFWTGLLESVPFLNRFIGIGSVFEPVLLKKQFWNQFPKNTSNLTLILDLLLIFFYLP